MQNTGTSSSKSVTLATVFVDSPPHLWKSCGRSVLQLASMAEIPSLIVSYRDDAETPTVDRGVGDVLGDCRHHPRALVLVARHSARILRRSDDPKEGFGACVWLAKLLARYAESVQRLRTPPGMAEGMESRRSKL
mmetsp:Transcript_26271/g.58517  ORF Transcript_26271/g.58517 Transcript_26271/m.58517 type:complete len:135 (-) Transcript_26271:671-1075(-)